MPGNAGEACGRVMASARMRPALMNPITVGGVANITWVSPASSDCAAGPPPLNCIEVNFTPATVSNATAASCGAEPYPAPALNNFPGLALA